MCRERIFDLREKRILNHSGGPSRSFEKSPSERAGFTLIELLVVIAIIVLLMVILIPVLQNAREQGQRGVFMDLSYKLGNGFFVPYLYPKWDNSDLPPIQHADGVTLSMADGHAEYWKWKARETVSGMPRMTVLAGINNLPYEVTEEVMNLRLRKVCTICKDFKG